MAKDLEKLRGEVTSYRQQDILVDKQLKDYELQIEKQKNSIEIFEHDKKECQIKLSNQMEEIKRLGEQLYNLEAAKDQAEMQLKSLKMSQEILESEKQDYLEQLRNKDDELCHSQKEKKDIHKLSKELERLSNDKNELTKLYEKARKDIETLSNHAKIQYEFGTKAKSEIEKLLMNLKSKTTECNEWKQKYTQSDNQIAKMEKELEDLQKELYIKTKHAENNKNKEIEQLEADLRAQFEAEIQSIQRKSKTIQDQNKELSSEVVRIANENSELQLRLKRFEDQQSNKDIEFDKVKNMNNELTNKLELLQSESKKLVPVDQLYASQRKEDRYKTELTDLQNNYQRILSKELESKRILEEKLEAMGDYYMIKQKYDEIEEERYSYLEENKRNKSEYLQIQSKYSQMSQKYHEKNEELSQLKSKLQS